jgi:hypothetical protein
MIEQLNNAMVEVPEIRIKTRIHHDELQAKVGKILTPEDLNLMPRGPVRVYKPDGKLLLHYLPGAFSHERMSEFYDTLHSLKSMETTNRGLASGTERYGKYEQGGFTYSKPVASAIVGAFDAKPPKNYCRLTAWTGKENEQWRGLYPLFQDIGRFFAKCVPDRYAAQMEYVGRTADDWVIEGTPFTTITVNNTYPTGVHTDKGDLDAGFSTLVVLRRGQYSGGWLTFPEYRIGVDMQDGDLLLMDAHEWHGNVTLTLEDPACDMCDQPASVLAEFARAGKSGTVSRAYCAVHSDVARSARGIERYEYEPVTPAERISVVSYYRTRMAECGTASDEEQKAVAWGERRIEVGMANAEVERMAEEAVG